MKTVFFYQDIWDLVKIGVSPIGEDTMDEQKTSHKELRKKDYKAFFIIHQCVNPYNFEKVGDVDSSKETWDTLEKSVGGVEKVKQVRLQTHKERMSCFRWKKLKVWLIIHYCYETSESNQDVWRSVDIKIDSCKDFEVITSKIRSCGCSHRRIKGSVKYDKWKDSRDAYVIP